MSRHYSRAPIAEAVIDLHVVSSTDIDGSAFNEVANSLSQYPKRLPITGIQMGFVGGSAEPPKFTHKHEPVGLRLETQNGNRVLQLQKRTFTFSHLPPYSSWQEFRAEALPLWSLYVRAARVEAVSRLAVRVINKLQLPAPLSQLSTFSNVLPHMPEQVPVAADKFFMQFQLALPHVAESCRAIINVASSESSENRISELLLDFDLFVEQRMPPEESAVFSLLDKLSEGKNQLFEACITDATRALIG